ncbi:methyltransferase domain-containing protein [Paenibacillus sp. FSL L8-0436]|uniref:class I SAM-dependent methyltransferase n=1 Tax=Paenibacillus sp. FSL L8-0436 TaxID=2954686 RepID=UPI0031589C3A
MKKENTIKSYSSQELEKVIHYLDGPLRIALKENEAVILHADLKEGDCVLDIGCGTGFLSLIAAQKVNASGKVIGMDSRQEMLDVMQKKAEKRGLDHIIKPCLGDACSLEFSDNFFDAVVMSYVLHENSERTEVILSEIYRVLKPGKKLVISDFIKVADPERNKEIEAWHKGTDPESDADEVHLKFSLSDYISLFEKNNFKDVKGEVWIEFQGIVEGRK